jgi:hypothetical protein
VKIGVPSCLESEQLDWNTTGLHERRTRGRLIDGTVIVDAETRTRQPILPSHPHFDHSAGMATFDDKFCEHAGQPGVIVGTADILENLQPHIFNDIVYPNFLKSPALRQAMFDGAWIACSSLMTQRDSYGLV